MKGKVLCIIVTMLDGRNVRFDSITHPDYRNNEWHCNNILQTVKSMDWVDYMAYITIVRAK